jgi:hypothetical protein
MRISFAVLLLRLWVLRWFAAAPGGGQSPPVTGAAPVPAQILSAKKVFISNAGFDGNRLCQP